YDCVVDGFACFFVPDDGGFTLVRNTNGS
ncbi:hypothetical protein D030_3042, partial [Vibrio parahaemolyticus AQ3810]